MDCRVNAICDTSISPVVSVPYKLPVVIESQCPVVSFGHAQNLPSCIFYFYVGCWPLKSSMLLMARSTKAELRLCIALVGVTQPAVF